MKRVYFAHLVLLLTLGLGPHNSISPIKASPSSTKTWAKRTLIEKSLIAAPITIQVRASDPHIIFSEGHAVPTVYGGESMLERDLEQNRVIPLALTSADFDEDGVPDLVSAYAEPGGGILTLHRGNIDSIYPNSPEAQRRKASGEFIDSPFLPSARVFYMPSATEFLGAGDFDADGHWDVAAAHASDRALYIT
jgi:hypothetical protein